MRRINLKDEIIRLNYEVSEAAGGDPGLTSRLVILISMFIFALKKSIIQGISSTRLNVAMKSNQKKKLYLKSLTTQDYNSNSMVNRISDKNNPA